MTLISPDGRELKFDIVIKTPKGAIYATILKRNAEVAGAEIQKVEKVQKLTLEEAHKKLGHCDIEKARRTAKALGWHLSDGVMNPCASCAAGKAKQKNVPKASKRQKSTEPGQMIFHDISTIGDREGVKSPCKQWHLMVDDYSMFCITGQNKTKDAFIEPFCKVLKEMIVRLKRKNVIVRMDNSGENKKFQERSSDADWQLSLS
eukprot:scaffold65232_cov49-Cyclotella_meneghiniana.AAC.7